MALSPDTNVYMEAMEETQNQAEKPDKDGNSRVLCTYGGKQPKRKMVLFQSYNNKTSHDKGKTDKKWIL